MHLVDDQPIESANQAERAWGGYGYAIAFMTSQFDVLDLPGYHGAPAPQAQDRCATATARSPL